MARPGEETVSTIRHRQLRAVLWGLQGSTAAGVVYTTLSPVSVHTPLLIGILLLIGSQFVVIHILSARSDQALLEREELLRESQIAHQQIEILFEMTDLLQSSDTIKDAGMVLENATHRLLPNYAGAIYGFNKKHERLEITRKWGEFPSKEPVEALAAHRCWALKRGKLHINDRATGTLLCKHYTENAPTIEVPMVARGSLHGLLILTLPAQNAQQTSGLEHDIRLAQAMSDSLSLALSNIELRETLRVQSLHDPLTGLYNRRYMEDALKETLASALRNGTPTSVLMIDLDNFKQINDRHGHAMGDIVLCEVAQCIVGALRPTDIVSRYGGEEILVIMPDCSHQEALNLAEILRKLIESLSAVHNETITASFGIATAPDMAESHSEIIARADDALYVAKHAGRNRIMSAVPTSFADDGSRRLLG